MQLAFHSSQSSLGPWNYSDQELREYFAQGVSPASSVDMGPRYQDWFSRIVFGAALQLLEDKQFGKGGFVMFQISPLSGI